MEDWIHKTCDECKSTYYADTSKMSALCPECAHALYGYPNCEHSFELADGSERCTWCGWNGRRSRYVRGLLGASDKRD